jgi:2-iminobutanoate/2-iminopropanoate deaminase
MSKIIVSTPNAPAPIGPYSQGVRARGEFTFVSGQTPLKPSGELVTGSLTDQTRQVMENIKAILQEADLQMDDIVKTTILLTSMDHFAEVNTEYAKYFPADPPARATFAVVGLPMGVDVEIEAIAVRS